MAVRWRLGRVVKAHSMHYLAALRGASRLSRLLSSIGPVVGGTRLLCLKNLEDSLRRASLSTVVTY
eukprot:350866-Chlamydomonas_euryale.AAC.7